MRHLTRNVRFSSGGPISCLSATGPEDLRPDTLYLSTGGGWAPATDSAIRILVDRSGVQLVAATDNNKQGDVYAGRLLGLAEEAGCGAERLRPIGDDWNIDLKMKEEAGNEKEEGHLPHARRSPQG